MEFYEYIKKYRIVYFKNATNWMYVSPSLPHSYVKLNHQRDGIRR